MLKDNQIKAIELYYGGLHTVEQIAAECGYKDRKSIYDILKKPEAEEYIKRLANESVEEALNIFRVNSKKLAKKLVHIAEGDIKSNKVYAQLQALNSVIEKAGLTAKNTLILENKSNDAEDKNELLDMLEQDNEKE